jgi:hypothetical protein
MAKKRTGKFWFQKNKSKTYKVIYLPEHPHCRSDGSFLEHRYIMEQKINRYLKSTEIVHHIDGNSLNNNPNNLQILHFRDHNKLSNSGQFSKGITPWNKNTIKKNCIICDKSFEVSHSHDRIKCCSTKCGYRLRSQQMKGNQYAKK